MDATLVLVLFLTFLVGGMTLALAMGYRTIEKSRASESAHLAKAPPPRADVIPSFFATGSHASAAATIAFDEALLTRLEQHVRAEHAMVAQFVQYPSLDSLYRQSGSTLHVH